MIKKLLFLLLFVSGITAYSQDFIHTLTVSNETYTEITGTDANVDAEVWDDPYWDIPVGFDFMYQGVNYNMVSFGGVFGYGGEVMFGAYADATVRQTMAIYGEDLVDAAMNSKSMSPLSEVSYETSGTAGSRIFKLQWKNCAFYPQGAGPSSVSVNFQLWLYEGTNVIEFRYGAYDNPNEETGAGLNGLLVGFGKNVNIQTGEMDNFWALTEEESAPVVVAYPGILDIVVTSLMHPNPIDGRVYRFAQISNVSVFEPTRQSDLMILSNLVESELRVNYTGNQSAILDIYSMEGKMVQSERINTGLSVLSVQGLSSGYYLASVITPQGRQTARFMVK